MALLKRILNDIYSSLGIARTDNLDSTTSKANQSKCAKSEEPWFMDMNNALNLDVSLNVKLSKCQHYIKMDLAILLRLVLCANAVLHNFC